MKAIQAWKSASWKIKAAIILATLYLIYALLGFFLAPGLVRDNASQALSDLTGRQVTIDEVKINPLVLSATVNGFSVADEQTGVLAGFDQLYVNFQLSSLFRWSWHFDEILLDGLTLRARRNPGNQFSFDDVIAHIEEQIAADTDDPEPDEKQEDEGLPAISVASMGLTNGDLQFTEASGGEPHELTLPLAFTVANFSTKAKGETGQNDYAIRLEGPDGGALDWKGQFEFTPFTAQGTLSVEKVDLVALAKLARNEVRFTVPSGELDVNMAYHFESEPEPRVVLSDGEVMLRALQLLKPGEDTPSLDVPQLHLVKLGLDSLAQEVTIPEVTISEPKVAAVLDAQGVDLATLFLPPDEDKAEERAEAVKQQAQEAAERIQEAETLWKVKLDTLKVNGSQVAFTDRTLSPAQTVNLSDGQFTLTNLVFGEEATFAWEGSGTVQQAGKLTHSGEGQLAPLSISAQASLNSLPVVPFSPWLENQVPLSLASGQLGADVTATVKGEEPVVDVQGSATLSGFDLLENGQSLLKINNASVSGLSASTGNQSLRIKEVALTGMDMLHRMDEQGRDAGARLAAGMKPSSGGGSDDSGEPWQVSVDRVRIIGSQVRHEDQTLSPNFRMGLYEMSGNLFNLDTRPGRKATIDLTAQVDRYAPFSIKGTLTPDPLFTDMKISLHNYEMTGLTPYTGKFLGYKVEKGQLGVDTGVSIENNHLESRSDILADQFYLGEGVPSEEAVKAPVKLGLAVLRTRSGEITLPVKMSGQLDDPNFSVSGMILKVIVNVLVKAATAPFSMLAGLAGGENLETIPFVPGSAEPDAQTHSSLEALAKVLNERPDLKVALVGTTDAADRRAIAGQQIGQDVEGDDWSGIDLALQDKSQRRKLIRRYESRYDREAETLVSEPLPEDREQRDTLLARAAWEAMLEQEAAAIAKDPLVELSRLRSENAKAVLVQQFGVTQSRLYLNQSKVDGEVSGLTLKLEH